MIGGGSGGNGRTNNGFGYAGGNGGSGGNSGEVTINGGIVTVAGNIGGGSGGNGGNGGNAVIGGINNRAGDAGDGGAGGDGGNVTINGGTVTVSGGISGGRGGRSGNVGSGEGCPNGHAGVNGSSGGIGSCEITGGSFYVSSTIASTPTNGSDDVYLTTVTLDDVDTKIPVSLLTTNSVSTYGISDMITDTNGNLYLWLPEGTTITDAQTIIGEYQGSIITTTDISTSLGTLSRISETEKPTVSSITPNGDDTSLSGEIIISFNEAMNPSVENVSLDGDATLTGGTWSNYNHTTPYRISYYQTVLLICLGT